MKILIKYISKSMIEKKGRLFLVIISIAISAALLISSIGVVNIIENTYSKPMKAANEGMDIGIQSKTDDIFFETKNIKDDGVKDYQSEIVVTGIIDSDEVSYVNIRGKEDKNIEDNYILEGSTKELEDNTCIISKRISEDRNLKLNDNLKVTLNGEDKSFKIVGISANEGMFYTDKGNQFSIIVPYKYLSKYYKVEGKYNYLIAKSSEDSIKKGVEKFNEDNTTLKATKLYDEESVNKQFEAVSSALYMMLGVVIFISAVIIYGAFKLIITERLPTIGTFLSQGATKGKVKYILYLESVGYGIIGAVVGGGLGVVVLYFINRAMSPLAQYGIIEKFSINYIYLGIGFIFSIVLSLASAIIPIRKIRKLPVKEVILNDISTSITIGWTKFIAGVVLILISLVGYLLDNEWVINTSPILAITALLGIILVYPKIVDVITKLLCKIFKERCNVLFLSLNNLRTSKVLLGNITLIIIAFISSIIIASSAKSMLKIVSEGYENINYDVTISNIINTSSEKTTTNEIIEKLKDLEFVEKNSINSYSIQSGSVDDTSISPIGINPDNYKDYNLYLDLNSGNNEKVIDELAKSNDNVIILTDTIKKSLKKKDGDTVKLEINDVKEDFKIIGSINGKLYQSGSFALIKFDKMKKDFGIKEATAITVKTNKDAKEAKNEIVSKVKEYGATCTTKQEDLDINVEENNNIVQILSIFSCMTMAIAALGILNNISIGFIQRKREFAVYSSIGMNSKKRSVMLLLESVLSVIWATIITTPFSVVILNLLTKSMKLFGFPMEMELDKGFVPLLFVSSIIIIVIASMPIISKNKKLSVVQELKYE